jgi:hypothetical protein
MQRGHHREPGEDTEIIYNQNYMDPNRRNHHYDLGVDRLVRHIRDAQKLRFQNLQAAKRYAEGLLEQEEQHQRVEIEEARQLRENRYQVMRNNRRQQTLRNGPVRRGSLARLTEKPSYLDKMRAAKRRLNQICTISKSLKPHQLAKKAGTSHWSARKATFDMLFIGEVNDFEFEQHHPPAQVQRLDAAIADPDNFYKCSNDYKRELPQFSKRFIRKRLRLTGKRHQKIRDVVIPAARETPDNLLELLREILGVYGEQLNTILWFDVSEFLLVGQKGSAWQFTDGRARPPRPRKDVTSYHLLAICNREGFVAHQLLVQAPTAAHIRCFLLNVLSKVRLVQGVSVILDNSQPNRGAPGRGNLGRHLVYNIPRAHQYNLIELVFSKLKSMWWTRPMSPQLLDDQMFLLGAIANTPWHEHFAGFRRQYLRAIIKGCDHFQPRQRAPRRRTAQEIAEDEVFLGDD